MLPDLIKLKLHKMERFDSGSRLIPYSEEEDFNSTFMNEDSSSGYDSSDASDAEPKRCRPVGSPEQNSHRRRESRNMPDIIKVCSTHALSKDLKMILSLPEMCDVTFLVGPEKVPVYGVRAILSMRSRVFYQLILKHVQLAALQKKCRQEDGHSRFSSKRVIIPVRKYDPKVFRLLIEFLHSGVIDVTSETAPGLLCGAEQFHLEDLSNACWDFIERALTSGKSETLLEHTRKYVHHKTAQKLLDQIYLFMDPRQKTKGKDR